MPQTNTEEHGSRSGLPLLLPGTVWLRAAGADSFLVASHYLNEPRARELDALRVAVLERCDGLHTPAAIAESLAASRATVDACIEWWRAEAPAALLFRPPDVDVARAMRARLAAKDMLTNRRTAQSTSRSTAEFHRARLADAHRNFERHETTISYALSEPHPLLQGQRYGARVADRLIGNTFAPPLRILEVGAGLGLLAAAFLDRVAETAPDAYSRLAYTLLDLAPALVSAQRTALHHHSARTRWIEGDVETAALDDDSFDFILCNEMIADLTVEFACDAQLRARDPRTAAEHAILDYNLPHGDAPERFVVNTGAIRLLERLRRWLAPGGCAWITEYGAPHEFPQAVELPGHVEYSIRFDHLLTVAARLELEARCEPLATWLALDDTIEVMRGADATATAELLMPRLGVSQPSRPWLVTRERLGEWLGDAAPLLRHRGFFSLNVEDEGLSPAKFFVLSVRRPAGPVPQ